MSLEIIDPPPLKIPRSDYNRLKAEYMRGPLWYPFQYPAYPVWIEQQYRKELAMRVKPTPDSAA